MASPPEFELELEDSDLLKMLEEPLSPLTLLSISAIITTISLFFCGIPICMQIYRRRSTNEISGFPFLMGFLGGAFWLRYGLLKSDLTMVTVNVVGVSLMFLYLLFYLYHSRPRTSFLIQLLIVLKIVVVMLVLVHFYGLDSLKMLGFLCMTFNIVNFGAPLAGLTTVLRNRCCSTLPLPLCTANLLVSSQWCLYGVCVKDIFIIIPNGAGVLLASVQICLFLVLPRREGTHAPLSKCCPCVMDLEKGYEGGLIANVEEEGGRSGRRKRRAEKRGGGGAGTGHTAQDDANQNSLRVRNNKFLNRQRVIDRRMIPTTRTGCIEFLRAGGGFDASFGSVSSRATADSWMSNSAISRISSSLSHPELFAAVQQATDFDQSIGEAPAEMEDSTEIQSHHLPSASSSGFQSQGLARGTSQSRPANDEQLVPVDENSEPMAADRNGATSGTNGGGTTDLLFVRTLSVPDLMAKQPQTDGENRS